jgi:transposase
VDSNVNDGGNNVDEGATATLMKVKLTRFRGHLTMLGRSARMRKRRKSYSEEFRQQMVRLARSGRTAEDLGREFEPSSQTIRNWVKQAELDEGSRTDGLKTEEREELARLRRENGRLKEEREILSKAAAWFAQETEKKSKGSLCS